jgi:hypothetical protein
MSVPSAPNIYIRPRALIDSVFLYWRPPTELGGSAIINYTVTCTEASYSQTFPESVNRITVSSLSSGIDYTFQITATNSTGTGPAAVFRTVQVGLPPAGAQNVVATATTNTSATVNWNFSTNSGEAPTNWFVLSAIPSTVGAAPVVKKSAYGYELQRQIYNLTSGITYQILVQAVNDVGYAPPTALSQYITMAAPSFSPSEFPGLLFWGDMSQLSGPTVSEIPNLGNFNNPNVTLTGSGTVTTGALNGKNVLSLNTSQSFTCSQINVPNWTLFTVARKNTTDGRVFTDGQNAVYGYWGNYKATFSIDGGVVIPFWTGPPAITNTEPSWDIQTITKWNDNNGINAQFNWNGTPLLQGDSARYTVKDTLLSNVGINTFNGEQSASDVAEMLIFESALSQEEIQSVEGYLAWKWGLQTNLPTNHPYKTQAPQSTTQLYWNPTLLSGCQLWLDAGDKTSVQVTGTNINQWSDKSGNANHATAVNAPQYQNSSVLFNGSNTYFTTPYTAAPQVETIFIVLKSADFGAGQDVISGNQAGNREFYIAGNVARLATFGGGTTLFSNIALVNDNTFLIELTHNTTSAEAYIDASEGGSLTGNFSFSGGGTTKIGVAYTYYNGSISEIVIYNRQLNQEERQITEGYLAWKWGLQGKLPKSHPFAQIAPKPEEPVTFNPLSVQGCQLWFDAADQTSITRSGQNVTQLLDKSGNSNNGTPSGTVTYVNNTVNVTNGVINTPYTASPTIETVFVVVNLPSGQNQPILDSTTSGGRQLYGSNSRMFLSSVNVNTFIQGTKAIPSNTPILYDYTFTSSQIVEYFNGGVDNSVTGSFTFSGTGTTRIGGPLISEIIFFNRALTTTERQAIEGYLAWKWNLQSNLPQTHPFFSNPPEPNQPLSWSPKKITTLSLWLDGKDISGNLTSGTPVTTWLDKSSNKYNATAPTNSPTVESDGGVTFDGTTNQMYFNTPVPIKPTTTCFFVTSPSSTNNAYLYESGNVSEIILNYSGGQFQQFNCASTDGVFKVTGANPISLYNYTRVPNTSNIGYYMGNQAFNYNPVTTPGTAEMILLGNSTNGTFNIFGGTIYEMIFYEKALTDTERQVVEGYLAHKWNIQANLPTNHPFYGQAPLPNQPTSWQPSSLLGLNLWIDSADTKSVVPSNGNVLTVIDKSGNQNNMQSKTGIIGIDTTMFNGQPAMSLSNTYFTGSIRPSITSMQFTSFAVGTLNANSPLWALLLSLGANQTNSFDSPNYAYALARNNGALGFATNRNGNFVSTDIPAYDSPFLLYSSQQPNNGYIGVNGQLIPNTASTGISSAFNISEYSIGTQNNTTDVNGYYIGAIGEIILTNTTLSKDQRQIVEGYLAWKWALQATLPSSHPYFSSPPSPNEPQYFLPSNIPGLQAWYDGADPFATGTPPVNGTKLTHWADKSGNNYNTTAVTGVPIYSQNGLVFNGASYFSLPNGAIPYDNSTYSFYIVANVASSPSYIISGGDSTVSVGTFQILAYIDNTIYTQFGGPQFSTSVTYTPGQTFLINSLYQSGSQAAMFLNGTAAGSLTPGTLVQTNANNYIGCSNIQTDLMNGTISEILVFNTSQTVQQRQAIEGYLAWKWNAQAQLPLSHTYYSSPPAAGLVFPVDQLPLSEDTTNTGSNPQTVTTNGNVTYTKINGNTCARFDNSLSNYLSLPFTPTQNFTITYWFNVLDNGVYDPWSISSDSTGGVSFVVNPDLNNGLINLWLNFTGDPINAGGVNPYSLNTWYNVSLSVDRTTNVCKSYLNGILQNTVQGSGTLQNTNYLLLGKSSDNARAYNGYISQFCVYNQALTAQQVLYNYQNIVPITNIPNLLVLLKAIDYSGSGTWNDQSGNGFNASLEDGTIAKNQAGNGIILNGSTSWTFPDVQVNNSWTASVWYKNTGAPIGFEDGAWSAILCQIQNDATTAVNLMIGNVGGYTNGTFYAGFLYPTTWAQGTGIPYVNNSWINIQVTWDGTNLRTYLNSTLLGTTQPGHASINSGLAYRIGRRVNYDSYMVGIIGEVRIYNYPLTQAEVNADYLSSYNTFFFQPVQIPGCQLWLDGADQSTITLSGQNVTQWSDKSGNSNNATTAQGLTTYNQEVGLQFNGSGYFNLPNGCIPYGNSSYSIYVVSQLSGNPTKVVISGGNPSSGESLGVIYEQGGIIRTYFFGDDIDISLGSALNTKLLYGSFYESGGQRYAYLNAANQVTNTPGTRNQPSTNNYIGYGITAAFNMIGTISEILVFNTNHTTFERQAVEGYLAWKWNTEAQLPNTHPYYASPPQTTIFAPKIVLKASNYSGSGAWQDESGNGKNATLETGAIAMNQEGNGIVLDGSTAWTFPNVSAGANWTVNVWYKNFATINPGDWLITQKYNNSPNAVNLAIGNLDSFGGTFNNAGWFSGTGINLVNGKWTNIQVSWDGTNMVTYINGVVLGTTQPGSSSYDTGLDYRIGCVYQGFSGFMTGIIGEVRIYNYALSQAQVQADYISSYNTFLFEPTLIPGNQLWFDAADKSLMTLTGSTVTQWLDKSGNSYNTTAVTGTPIFSEGVGVIFTGSSYFTLPTGCIPYNDSSYSIYVIASFDDVTTQGARGGILGGGTAAQLSSLNVRSEMDNMLTYWYGADINSTGIIAANTPVLYDSLYESGGNRTVFLFGSPSGSDTPGTRSQPNGPNFLGTTVVTENMTGTISEVLVYNTNHTTNQRQVIEGYLAWKWQTQSQLPNNHPYYNNPPQTNALAPKVLLKGAYYSGSGNWLDDSGNGNNASLEQGTAALNQTNNGLVLNGATAWNFPNVQVGTQWTANVWFKKTGSSVYNSGSYPFAHLLTQIYNNSTAMNLTIGETDQVATFGGGFLRGGSWFRGSNITLEQNKWTNIQVTYDGTNMITYINGTLLGSLTLSNATIDNGGAYLIGRRWDGLSFIVGEIGEVRIYGYPLTQAQVTADYNDSYSTFYGPLILLKAINYSGSGSWLDESGNNKNATLQTGTIAKNTAGNGIVLNGSTSWTFPDVRAGSKWTASIWYKQNVSRTSGNPCILTQQYSSGQLNLFIGYGAGSNNFTGGFLNNNWYFGNSIPLYNGQWVNIQVTWDGTNMLTYINGVLSTSAQPGGTSGNIGAQPYNIGCGWSNTDFVTGEIGEVRIYNYPLSQEQVTADYNESLATFPAFTPTTITGCQLWFDGADESSMTKSGSAVTQWNDKSGNGYNTSSIVGTPTFSAGTGLVFNGSSYFNLPNSCIPYGNTSYSIYVIAKFSDLSTSPFRGLFGGGSSGFYSSLNACNFIGDTIIMYTGGDDIISTGTVSANTTFMYSVQFQTDSIQSAFINGTSSGSRTPTAVRIQPNTGNVLGSTVQGQNMYGSISEILVFNTNHTTLERQRIEGYLAWKWSLQSQLPSDHPYKSAAP